MDSNYITINQIMKEMTKSGFHLATTERPEPVIVKRVKFIRRGMIITLDYVSDMPFNTANRCTLIIDGMYYADNGPNEDIIAAAIGSADKRDFILRLNNIRNLRAVDEL